MPPVVAVVVASDPGDWFDETIESLSDVEYDNFAVLVIDNGGAGDLAARIAAIMPTAFVKRLESDGGFSAAANEVLNSVEGASFFLFLHDDVVLDPASVTELVAEAFRANAGVVGPKIVDWDDTGVLRSVGIRVDPFGFSSPISETGELDQEQHDTARNVFAVSDACMLVRADLFETIGGFDADIPFFGEDVDLCWRAQSAGASVAFAPAARVAHRERFTERRAVARPERIETRHETRTMLKNYSFGRLMWIVPVGLLLSLVEFLGSAVIGRFERCGDIAAAWLWNLTHIRSLVAARSSVSRTRRVPDREYVVRMRQGSSRLRGLVRANDGERRLESLAASGRTYLREATSQSRRGGLALLAVSVVILAYGSRNLLFGVLPSMREIPQFGRSGGQLFGEWLRGWRESGLGEPAVAPGVVPLAGSLGWLLGGSIGAARRLIVLGPVVIGAIGAWRLFSHRGSLAVRSAVLVVYSLSPVMLGALAGGRLGALASFAAAPWILRRAARGSGLEPFVDASDPQQTGHGASDLLAGAGGVGLLLFAVGAVTPFGALSLVVMLVIQALVAVVWIDRGGGLRMIRITVLGGVGALLGSVPWLVAAVRSGDGSSLTGLFHTLVRSPSAARIVTGSIGVVRVGLPGWGIVLAATFCVLAARKWRFGWAIAFWAVAITTWATAIILARAGLFGGAGLEIVLIPAVLSLASATGMGVFAFEDDVLGTDFGATQILAGVATVCLAIGLVPVLVASTDGRWYVPAGDFDSALEPVDSGHGFRTLWIGDPDVLPVSGWMLGDTGLAIGTTTGLDPSLTQRYRLDGGVGVAAMSEALSVAIDGQTSRLGRILGPMGIKYVIVVDRANPLPFAEAAVPMPTPVVAALRSQLDLASIDVNPAMATFRVDDSWPLRSDVTPLDEAGVDSLRDQLWIGQAVPRAVLGGGTGTHFTGRIHAGADVAQAVTADPGWSMTVNGDKARRIDFRGWAQRFEAPGGAGSTTSAPGAADVVADLRWSTPMSSRVLQLAQVLVLVVLIAMTMGRGHDALRIRRSSGTAGDFDKLVMGPERSAEDDGHGPRRASEGTSERHTTTEDSDE